MVSLAENGWSTQGKDGATIQPTRRFRKMLGMMEMLATALGIKKKLG
jgi:hypothetical protein